MRKSVNPFVWLLRYGLKTKGFEGSSEGRCPMDSLPIRSVFELVNARVVRDFGGFSEADQKDVCLSFFAWITDNGWACRKSFATTGFRGLAELFFGDVRFASYACEWSCLVCDNDSPSHRSIRCVILSCVRPLFLPRCGCFPAPCAAFVRRFLRVAVADAGRRKWTT